MSRSELTKTARILIVEDEEPYRELLRRRLSALGHRVEGFSSGEAAMARVAEQEFDVAVLDLNLPNMSGLDILRRFRDSRQPIQSLMLTGKGGVEAAVSAMKLGAYHYLEKPVKFAELKIHIERALEKAELERGLEDFRALAKRQSQAPQLIGEAAPMRQLRALLAKLAKNPKPVLIQGETGTGKDVCARLIHALSDRAEQNFVAINCGALAEGLLENELFGHARGAFTDAKETQRGVFEMADKGTLLIDELCEMNLSTQKKFLRGLESGEFRRLGEAKTRTSNARIIAATNKDVQQEVAEKRFRADLFYRLQYFDVRTPALREHREDIPELVQFFLTKNAGRYPKNARVSPEVMALFKNYDWPGNVRELQAILERGVVLSNDGVVRVGDCPGLQAPVQSRRPTPATPARTEKIIRPENFAASETGLTLEELEKGHIELIMNECSGNKTKAAQRLGISLRSLYRKLERHNLN